MGKMKEFMMAQADEHELRYLERLQQEAIHEKIKWDEFFEIIIKNRIGKYALVMYRNPDHLEKFVIEENTNFVYAYPTSILIGTSNEKQDLEIFCQYKSIKL